MDLKLITFNNYFNRKLKKMVSDVTYPNLNTIKNVSFNPGDGVTTTQIVNNYNDKCDYAVLQGDKISTVKAVVWKQDAGIEKTNTIKYVRKVTGAVLAEAKNYVDQLLANYPEKAKAGYPVAEVMEAVGLTGYTWPVEENVAIEGEVTTKTKGDISHWFIIESNRLRTGQYELTLRRDILIDYYDVISKSPIFVQKGYLEQSDPMICNDEGMILNKIKTEEILLKDKTNSAWIVGYVTKKELLEDTAPITSVKVQYGPSTDTSITPQEIATQLEVDVSVINEILSAKTFYGSEGESEINYGTDYYSYSTIGHNYTKWIITLDDDFIAKFKTWQGANLWSDPCIRYSSSSGAQIIINSRNVWNNNVDCTTMVKNSRNHTVLSPDKTKNLIMILNNNNVNYNDQIVKINANLQTSERKDAPLSVADSSINTIFNQIVNNVDNAKILTTGNAYIWLTEQTYNLQFETVATENTYTIPLADSSNRRDCAGSVCDIFAIPFGSCPLTYEDEDGVTFLDTIDDKTLLFKIASAIATTLDKQLYDIQLLPYCPLTKRNLVRNKLVIDSLVPGKDFDWIIDGKNNKKSIIYWLSSNQLTFNINLNLTVEDRKIESNTDMIRFSSPNGQGNFDMNVAKNNGLDYVTINTTYKPYQPYIQVLPNFKGLYGANYNDYRGLICNGDFSLTRLTDEWIQYQLNNKNYQNIFNREIYNLDLSQRQERNLQYYETGVNTISSGVSGAVTGGSVGGAYGAVAGAIIGTTAGAISGVRDVQYAEEARKNTRDYTIDRFNFNLGNIKALPNSITKIDSFVVNSKLFPFLEKYTCTNEEKDAFKNKIKYDGMTINRIGSMIESKKEEEHFFKGQVIRINDIECDTHIINAIYDELLKGVYL